MVAVPVLAGALPERVTHLGLIDGVIPPTGAEQDAGERLGMALQAQLRLDGKRKSVYATLEAGVQARMKGMVAVSGEFSRGDVIAIRNAQGQELARGLANYSAGEARLLCRKSTNAVEGLLGYAAEPEMIHRDNLVLSRG